MFLTPWQLFAGGKIYEPKDPKYGQKKNYTHQQKINRGTNASQKIYTTCRLMKRIKSRQTYTLMYEDNCPRTYNFVYQPWGKEPNIDDVVDSLNSIKK